MLKLKILFIRMMDINCYPHYLTKSKDPKIIRKIGKSELTFLYVIFVVMMSSCLGPANTQLAYQLIYGGYLGLT